MANPAVRISHQALTLMRQYMSELGLTPASRARLATGKKDPEDPLEAFLQHGKRKR
jgi:P27 family predicted phage terminase small subunit